MSLRPPFVLGPTVRTADGAGLATYDFGGEGPSLLLAHATGFHGRCWLPLVPVLRTSYHCFAFDLRGHGRSSESPDGRYDWRRFRDDTLAVIDGLGLERPFGVGHSWGASLLLLSAAERPDAFADMYCYEPVFAVPPAPFRLTEAHASATPGEAPLGVDPERGEILAQGARRRREVFESREAALARFVNKSPFDRFDPFAAAAYVDYGLVDLPDGHVRLRCRGETEARCYEAVAAAPTFAKLPGVQPLVALAGGGNRPDIDRHSLEAMAERLPAARVRTMEGLSHFGPMEDPNRVADSVVASFGSRG